MKIRTRRGVLTVPPLPDSQVCMVECELCDAVYLIVSSDDLAIGSQCGEWVCPECMAAEWVPTTQEGT